MEDSFVEADVADELIDAFSGVLLSDDFPDVFPEVHDASKTAEISMTAEISDILWFLHFLIMISFISGSESGNLTGMTTFSGILCKREKLSGNYQVSVDYYTIK